MKVDDAQQAYQKARDHGLADRFQKGIKPQSNKYNVEYPTAASSYSIGVKQHVLE